MQSASNLLVAQLESVPIRLAGHSAPPGGQTPPVGLEVCPVYEHMGGLSRSVPLPVPHCILCLVCLCYVVCMPFHIHTILCIYQVCIMYAELCLCNVYVYRVRTILHMYRGSVLCCMYITSILCCVCAMWLIYIACYMSMSHCVSVLGCVSILPCVCTVAQPSP